jgi:hypothetical protein
MAILDIMNIDAVYDPMQKEEKEDGIIDGYDIHVIDLDIKYETEKNVNLESETEMSDFRNYFFDETTLDSEEIESLTKATGERAEILDGLPEHKRKYNPCYDYMNRKQFSALEVLAVLEPEMKNLKTRYRKFHDWRIAMNLRNIYAHALLEEYGGGWKIGSKKSLRCYRSYRDLGFIPFFIPAEITPVFANTQENMVMHDLWKSHGTIVYIEPGEYSPNKPTDYESIFENAWKYDFTNTFRGWLLVKEKAYRNIHIDRFPNIEETTDEELLESLVNNGCEWGDDELNEKIRREFPEYILTESKIRLRKMIKRFEEVRKHPEFCEWYDRMLGGHPYPEDEADGLYDENKSFEEIKAIYARRERAREQKEIDDSIDRFLKQEEIELERRRDFHYDFGYEKPDDSVEITEKRMKFLAKQKEEVKHFVENVRFKDEDGKWKAVASLSSSELWTEKNVDDAWVDLQVQSQAAAKVHKKMMKVHKQVLEGKRTDLKDEKDLIIYEHHLERKVQKKLRKQFISNNYESAGNLEERIHQRELDEAMERLGITTEDYDRRHPAEYLNYIDEEDGKVKKLKIGNGNKVMYKGIWRNVDEFRAQNISTFLQSYGWQSPYKTKREREEEEREELRKKEQKRLKKLEKERIKKLKELQKNHMYEYTEEDLDYDPDDKVGKKKKNKGVEDPDGEVLNFLLGKMADDEAEEFKSVLGELISTGEVSPRSHDRMLNPKVPKAILASRGWT